LDIRKGKQVAIEAASQMMLDQSNRVRAFANANEQAPGATTAALAPF